MGYWLACFALADCCFEGERAGGGGVEGGEGEGVNMVLGGF